MKFRDYEKTLVMFVLAGSLLAFLLGANVVQAGTPADHTVMVYHKNGGCTGVIVGNKVVLTVSHCHSQKEIYVSRRRYGDWQEDAKNNRYPDEKAEVAYRDEKADLLLLITNVPDQGMINLTDAILDEEMVITAYLKGRYGIYRGRITHIAENGILHTDARLMRGSSGAGMFNARGEMLGTVASFIADSEMTSQTVGNSTIKIPMILSVEYVAIPSRVVANFLVEAKTRLNLPKDP